MSENTVSENVVIENIISDNSVSENIVSENIIINNTISGNFTVSLDEGSLEQIETFVDSSVSENYMEVLTSINNIVEVQSTYFLEIINLLVTIVFILILKFCMDFTKRIVRRMSAWKS